MQKSIAGCGLIICLCFGLTPAGDAHAQQADDQPEEKQTEVWPQNFVVTVGDIRTRIDGPKMWTLSGITYRDHVMATDDSAYGTVLTLRNVGHLGTAHFLEVPGKPNEIEKENVTSLRLFVDGQRVTEFTPTMQVSCQSFRMERVSTIRDLELTSTVTLRDGVLIETQHFHATKAIDLTRTYPLMYAWTPEATHYAFGDDNGIQKQGQFLIEGEPDNNGLEQTARWMAVFDSATGYGGVCYLLKRPADADAWFQWTDAPDIYRKLRIMSFNETVVPKGFDGTYQAAIGFFTATESDWQQQALRRITELKTEAHVQ